MQVKIKRSLSINYEKVISVTLSILTSTPQREALRRSELKGLQRLYQSNNFALPESVQFGLLAGTVIKFKCTA